MNNSIQVRRRSSSSVLSSQTVDYNTYVQPPTIEKYKYIKRKPEQQLLLETPETVPPLVYIRASYIDPAPIGLFGLGMGCLLVGVESLVPSMSHVNRFQWTFFLPGLLQILSGIVDIQRGSLFGSVAFIGFGIQWVGQGLSQLFGLLFPTSFDPSQFDGVVLAGYIFFSFGMLLITLGLAFMYTVLLAIVVALFTVLTISCYVAISPYPVGILFLVAGGFTAYLFLAEILKAISGRHIIPMGGRILDYETLTWNNPFKEEQHPDTHEP